MNHKTKMLFHWLLAAGVAGALLGGIASAQRPDCYKLYPCGCASDGGYLYCAVEIPCQ